MIKNFLLSIRDFFFPPLCFICDNLKENEFFCKNCLELILRARIQTTFCKKHTCKIKFKYLDEVYAIFNYTDKIKDLIEAYKFKRYIKLSKFFAPFVIERIEKFVPEFDFLIPVPLHPSRKRERGFNQAERILEEIRKIKEINYRKDILIRIKKAEPQAKIKDREKRKINVENAFLVIRNREIKNKKVLLLDDVFTTGSTLEECARALKERKAFKVYALCLATSS